MLGELLVLKTMVSIHSGLAKTAQKMYSVEQKLGTRVTVQALVKLQKMAEKGKADGMVLDTTDSAVQPGDTQVCGSTAVLGN